MNNNVTVMLSFSLSTFIQTHSRETFTGPYLNVK